MRREHKHPVPTVECRACEGSGIGGEYVPELCGEGEDQECTGCDGHGTIELAWRYEVCERCEGRGTQCKLGAMTGEEYREMIYDDPDFVEDYKSGMYDEPCRECRGLRVVAEIDYSRCLPWQIEAWEEQQRAKADDRRDYEMGY